MVCSKFFHIKELRQQNSHFFSLTISLFPVHHWKYFYKINDNECYVFSCVAILYHCYFAISVIVNGTLCCMFRLLVVLLRKEFPFPFFAIFWKIHRTPCKYTDTHTHIRYDDIFISFHSSNISFLQHSSFPSFSLRLLLHILAHQNWTESLSSLLISDSFRRQRSNAIFRNIFILSVKYKKEQWIMTKNMKQPKKLIKTNP